MIQVFEVCSNGLIMVINHDPNLLRGSTELSSQFELIVKLVRLQPY